MLYLAEANGVVVGLRPCVEVHGLLDVIVALVVPGQVVGRRPVTSVVGDLRRLASHKHNNRISNNRKSVRHKSFD